MSQSTLPDGTARTERDAVAVPHEQRARRRRPLREATANLVVAGTLGLGALAGAVSAGCSSAETPPGQSDAGSRVDSGGSHADSGGGVVDSGGAADSGANFGSYGKTCSNPVNGGSGGGGGDGGSGGAIDGGGSDPNCVGIYNLCASVGSAVKCTKPCNYTGTSGAQTNNPDCPVPPTNGTCTPRGFCQ